MKVLEQLARIEAHETFPFPTFATAACATLSWGTSILTITPTGSPDVCAALHQLVRSGFTPVLIAVAPDRDFGLVRERARHLGFQARNVPGPRALDQWQRPVQRAKQP